jgi:4-aminobutyrate aminotransferase
VSSPPIITDAELALGPVPLLRTEVPGPRARAVIARDRSVTSPSLARVHPLVPARASGSVIEDVDGNRFLDFNAGIAVTATGHCHPKVVAAVEQQAHAFLHYCSSDWYVPAYTDVCERLAASAPMGGPVRVYLGNSGTEAVEAAIKLSRHATGRPNIIAFLGAFHGRTLGSLSLTASKAHYRAGFGPFLPGVYHAPYGAPGAIENVILRHQTRPEDVAAIVVEPIQGEGGYVVPPPGWIAELRRICDAHGILLVADEVQSGVGRTGRMWAIEHEGVEPDVVLAGKGLASGLPLSAVIARESVMRWEPGMHGSTFGGNPVACAAALATLDLVEDGLIAQAEATGTLLRVRLEELARKHSCITDVRGRGLMVAIDLGDHDGAVAVEQRAFDHGLVVLTAGASAIRLSPALTLSRAHIETAVDILDAVLATMGE